MAYVSFIFRSWWNFLILLFFTIIEEIQTDTCKTYYSAGSPTFYYTYCSSGCCGSGSTIYCCTADQVGTYVGAAIGGLVSAAIIIVLIFVCCHFHKKHSRLIGSDIHPPPEVVHGDSPPYRQENTICTLEDLDDGPRNNTGPFPIHLERSELDEPPPGYTENVTNSVSVSTARSMSPPPLYQESHLQPNRC